MRLSRFFRPSVSSVFSVGTLLALVVALLTAPLGAQTAKSRAALYTEIDTNLPSTTGAITAAVLRAQLKNIVASANNTINADAQPIDADLTAIAALTTTSFGRGLLTEASDATLKTTLALNLVTNTADADKPVSTAQATAIAAAQAASQPLDADLTAIAALTTASYGRSLLTLADAAALRTSAALVIGTNVQAFDAELDAISGISANGLIARTSASTAAARTLTGTAGQITVTNGDGVAGNPTLSLPTALTSINSITSAAASNLTLGTGSFGTALTFASATGAATFSAPVSVFGSTGTEVNFALNQSGVGQWSLRNIATSGDFRLSVGGNDWFSIVRATGAATFTNTLSVSGTTASTSTTTGSLINSGGFGNAGAAYFGGSLNLNNGGILFQIDGTTIPSTIGLWFRQASPSTSNYGLSGDASNTILNAPTGGTVALRINNGNYFALTAAGGYVLQNGKVNITDTTSASSSTVGAFTVGNGSAATNVAVGGGNIVAGAQIRSTSATGGIGYATGAGGAVTQITSRTTGVTLNTVAGAITLFTAAGSATWQSFTVTNSAVAATDTIIVNQRSGTDLYMISVTAVGAGSFRISFATTGGTTSEAPVFNFSVIKAVSS